MSVIFLRRRRGAPVAPPADWELTRLFDTGVAGTKAEGADAFDALAGRTSYSTARSVSGAQSAECRVLTTDSNGGFGQWGGAIDFPAPVGKGSVLWLEQYVFLPAGFSISTPGNGSLKYIRIRNRTSAGTLTGYLDIQLRDDDRTDNAWRYIKEGVATGWVYFGDVGSITRGQWLRHTFAIQLDNVAGASGGTPRVRVWQDGALLVDSTTLATLTTATDYTDSYYLFTYWNGTVPQDQSFFVDSVRMGAGPAGYVPSWATGLQGVDGGPSSGSVAPFFADGFEGGQFNPAGGVTYANDRGTPVRCEPTTANPHAGSHGLQMTFNIPASLGGSSRTQLNMSLGRQLQEAWIEYYLFVPSNFTPTPGQMKQIRLYGGTYDALNKVGASTFAISGEQRMRYMYTWQGYDTSLVGAGPAGESNAQSPTSVFGAPGDRGRFVRHRWHFKMVSALNAADAEFHYWVDDTLAIAYTNIPARYDPTTPYWDQLYILGSADAPDGSSLPFGNQEVICTLDTLRLYDTNPGWL